MNHTTLCSLDILGSTSAYQQQNPSLPIVHIKSNQTYANSKDVADYFGKRHDNILRKITEEFLPNLTASELRWFNKEQYQDAKGQYRICYDMTRDGFTLIAMGLTGVAALGFKLKYIEQFNIMEAELKKQYRYLMTHGDNFTRLTNQVCTKLGYIELYVSKVLLIYPRLKV